MVFSLKESHPERNNISHYTGSFIYTVKLLFGTQICTLRGTLSSLSLLLPLN